MTTKEMAIQKVEKDIERKEKEIVEIQQEISILKKELEEYRNIPDSYYDTTLESCEDFPLSAMKCYHISKQIGISFCNGYYKEATINDLIHSSPKELLKTDGIGKASLKLIEEWMEKHGLHFIS